MPNHSKATFKMIENVMALLLTYVPKCSWCVIWRRQQPSSQFLPLNQRTESRSYVQCSHVSDLRQRKAVVIGHESYRRTTEPQMHRARDYR